MEPKTKIEATVISPAKSGHKRLGKGFSLIEIKEAGKTIEVLKENRLKIDYFRKSSYNENVELLKKLKPLSTKKKKRDPFTYKEKKHTPFKVKEEKPKPKPKEVPSKPQIEKTKPKVKKTKAKPVIDKKEIEKKGIPLTSLSGLGPATATKLKELGVESVEQLITEDPKELGTLIKGVSKDRIEKWIEEAKELLK